MKIDRSFISGIGHDVRDQQLVHAIIELGHLFDAEVNAEGIEEREQFTVLSALGCDVGQGHYFGRPLDAGSFDAFMLGTYHAFRRGGISGTPPLRLNGGAPAPRFACDEASLLAGAVAPLAS